MPVTTERVPQRGDRMIIMEDMLNGNGVVCGNVVTVTCVHPTTDGFQFCTNRPDEQDQVDWYPYYGFNSVQIQQGRIVFQDATGVRVARRVVGRRNITALPLP